jgi:hypothetical protein
MTRDHEDFADLHDLVLAVGGHHPGILVVRFDNDPAISPLKDEPPPGCPQPARLRLIRTSPAEPSLPSVRQAKSY